MTIEEQILEEVSRGRQGLNHGISIGMPKLESIMDGNTRETYTLIMSNSGSGKTSYALYCYVYRAIMEHLDDDDYKCLYICVHELFTTEKRNLCPSGNEKSRKNIRCDASCFFAL